MLPEGKDSVDAMCLGVVRDYASGPCISTRTGKNLVLMQELTKWIRSRCPDFRCTSIQLNRNPAPRVHTDSNNVGESVIVSLGQFRGGGLWIMNTGGQSGRVTREVTRKMVGYPKLEVGDKLAGSVVDIFEKPFRFDGTVPHSAMAYNGERYAIVFFTHRAWNSSDRILRQKARSLGLPVP